MSMNDQRLTQKSFSTISVIGKGGFAKVILVKSKIDNNLYAMKAIKKDQIHKKKQEKCIIAEREVLITVDHPFIVKFFASFQSERKLYFVLEYCPGGELFNLLRKRIKLSEGHTRFYAAQLVLALEHLHSHGIAYRDLKPENILIDKEGYLRAADFGLSWKTVKTKTAAQFTRRIKRAKTCTVDKDNPISQLFDRKNVLKRICGTAEYIAPEILSQKGYGKEVDLWALGILTFEMLTGRPPFFSNDKTEQMEMIQKTEPRYPHYMSEDSIDFIKCLLAKDPRRRIGHFDFEEVKGHRWFKDVDWEKLYNKEYEAPYRPAVRDELDLHHFDQEFVGLNFDTFYMMKESNKPSPTKFRGFYFDDLNDKSTNEGLSGLSSD